MKRKLQIKAGNIGNLTDARYFAALGVQWLGFNFRKDEPNALQLEDAKTIQNWITGPTIVAEFSTIEVDYIFEICHNLQTNFIQIPGQDNLHDLHKEYKIIQVYHNNNYDKNGQTSFLRLGMHSVEQVNAAISHHKKIIFKINDDIELTKHIIKNTQLVSIEIQGSNEQEVGIKSFDELNDLLEWLELNNYLF